MAADEPFKRYEQAGAAFVNRLNGLLRGASDAGGKASGPDDEPGGARRERTEHLLEMVRSEIRSQLAQLGLATREEIDDVRSRLDQLESRLGDLESRLADLRPPTAAGEAGAANGGGGGQSGEAEPPGESDSGGTQS